MNSEANSSGPSFWRRFSSYLTDLAYALDATPQEVTEHRLRQIEQRLALVEASGQER